MFRPRDTPGLQQVLFLVLHSQRKNFVAGWMVWMVIEEIANQIYDHQQLNAIFLYV